MGPIAVMANTDAVDIIHVTKDAALLAVAAREGVGLHEVAAIGDGLNDLPFLGLDGLALVGAPSNAQDPVRAFVSSRPNGVVCAGAELDGFREFYAECARRGVKLVFSDRDGVLISHGDLSGAGEKLSGLFGAMGTDGAPFVYVLTGSGAGHNLDLLADPAVAGALSANPAVRGRSGVFLVENGALAVDALDRSVAPLPSLTDAATVAFLTGPYRRAVEDRVRAEVLPAFGLSFTGDRADQHGKILTIDKQTMVTFNIPHSVDGIRFYRRSPESELLRAAIAKAATDVAAEMGVVLAA
jgi:hypothetical protein